MRLVSAYCKGYRRFYEQAEMNLDPRLVCIVGPNAAGKSSFLKALTHLNRDFDGDDFPAVDHTRSHAGDRIEVGARYELDDDDRAALASVPEAALSTHLIVRRYSGRGDRTFDLDPPPVRNRAPRLAVAKRLENLQGSRWARNRAGQDSSEGLEFTDSFLGAVAESLRKDGDTLSGETVTQLDQLVERMPSSDETYKQVHQTRGGVEQLIEAEQVEHPHRRAVRLLEDRVPPFVEFREDLRQLAATYNIDEEPDDAIENVLALAGTSWTELTSATNGDDGRKKTWVQKADRTAREKLADWKQQGAELRLSFNIDGRALTLLMEMSGDEYIAIDQHSDGLRQFIALRALIELQNFDVDPVVLIDEADTHLHYDAQADLVRVLESAEGVSKIVYTTHSAGCLPHDLGTGIRAVVPILGGDGKITDFSRIEGRFWTHGEGFSPLLIAMGASAFAFSATQRALITEGISDAMLLPSMIREATGLERLPYQVVPGFAEAQGAATSEFDLMASRTAFVADGDAGGDQHGQKLINNGVSTKQIIYLGGQGNGISTEDLLVREVYRTAVNDVLESLSAGPRIPDAEIPATGRANAVKNWAEAKRVGGKRVKVRKAAVAQRVLDNRAPGMPILSKEGKKALRSLHNSVNKILRTPTQRL
jgi:energy-coupling factor transporter ATP-binding protein EcfA2